MEGYLEVPHSQKAEQILLNHSTLNDRLIQESLIVNCAANCHLLTSNFLTDAQFGFCQDNSASHQITVFV